MDQTLTIKLAQLKQALSTLQNAIEKDKDEYMRDSAIKRFEYCFELFWKTAKQYFVSEGLDIKSPKEAIRTIKVFRFYTPEQTEKALQMLD